MIQQKQTTLFGDLNFQVETKEETITRRLKIAQKALDAKSEVFKSAYRNFAVEFASKNETFLAEEIRFAYLETRLPRPYSKNPKDAWKSTGAIISKLIKDGLLDYYRVDGRKQFRYSKGGERQMVILTRGSK